MLFNLVGTFLVGIAAVGSIMLIFLVLRRPAPRWLLPFAAGAGMLGFHLWNEYTWFDRTATALPDHVVVAKSYTYETPFQPWTLLMPRINRFAAVDRASIRRHDEAPDYVMADIFLVTRLAETAKVTQIYDCVQARRTEVSASMSVDERGLPVDAAWTPSEADEPLFKMVCDRS